MINVKIRGHREFFNDFLELLKNTFKNNITWIMVVLLGIFNAYLYYTGNFDLNELRRDLCVIFVVVFALETGRLHGKREAKS